MATVVLNEFDAAMYEAECCYNEYVELSGYQVLFESEDPKVKETVQNNEKVATKGKGAIGKLVQVIKNMISNIATALKTCLQKFRLGDDEKAAYKEFVAKCKEDPSLKNKKVTIKDWKQIEAQYDALLKEVDVKIREEKKNHKTPIQGVIDDITAKLKSVGKSTVISVGAETALTAARSNRNAARVIDSALNFESGILDQMEQQFGEKNTTTFKKDIESCTKHLSLRKLKVMILHKKSQSLMDNIKYNTGALGDIFHGKIFSRRAAVVGGRMKQDEVIGDGVKHFTKAYGSARVGIAKDKVTNKISGALGGDDPRTETLSGFDYVTGRGQKKIEHNKAVKKAQQRKKKDDREKKLSKYKFVN